MNKKKILFVVYNFEIGGIQKALLNMCKAINEFYDIDIFAFYPKGALKHEFLKICNLINPRNKKTWFIGGAQNNFKNRPDLYFERAISAFFAKKIGAHRVVERIIKKEKIDKQYDVAVSYAQNTKYNRLMNGCNNFILQNVKAYKKIAFIHSDYIKQGLDTKYNNEEYLQFDEVVSVSLSTANIASKILKVNVRSVQNFVDFENVVNSSNEKVTEVIFHKNTKTFVTLARLSPEKGLLRTIEIMRQIKEEGFKFQWVIVGGGPLEKELRANIIKYNLSDCVFLVGEVVNPYKFLAHADYLLITSYHEAAPMVVEEAFVLKIPILSVDFSSAKEKITANGIIVNNDKKSLYEGIKMVLNIEKLEVIFDPEKYNFEALKQFNQVIEG